MENKPLFSEKEKNDVIATIVEQKLKTGHVKCPFRKNIYECKTSTSPCSRIFGKIYAHPCAIWTEKYVTKKFWSAMNQ